MRSEVKESQRAELLTQELETAMAWLHALADPHDDSIDQVHKSCAAALLQHIAALQSQLDTAQKDNLARHRQCGELRTKVAALTQRVEAADKLAATANRAHAVMLAHMNPHYRAEIAAAGREQEFDEWAMCQELRRELEAYRALSQEPRDG